MARRRTKKSTFKRRLDAWRKAPGKTVGKVLAYRPPHSSVFVIGLGIGLAVGLSFGVGLSWLDGRHVPEPVHTQVADGTPPPAPVIAPAEPVITQAPPAYIEQTEPVPPESADVPLSEPAPPVVVEATPPALPQTTEPQPPAFAPAPQPAEPGPVAEPAWLKNAVASIDPGNRPMIAIVLDDVGATPGDVPGALGLPGPVTLSIMTYASNATKIAAEAHRAGHEIMVHVPMEPINRDADPGPNALLTSLNAEEIARRLDWGLSQFPGYVGINNHMGSKFTQNAPGMRIVLEALKQRGLLFLDSRTIANSVGYKLATEIGVTTLQRDIFLDDVIDEVDIKRELARTEAIARKTGIAIAIGHPHRDTVEALRQWIPEAKARGFILVPISTIAKKRSGVTG